MPFCISERSVESRQLSDVERRSPVAAMFDVAGFALPRRRRRRSPLSGLSVCRVTEFSGWRLETFVRTIGSRPNRIHSTWYRRMCLDDGPLQCECRRSLPHPATLFRASALFCTGREHLPSTEIRVRIATRRPAMATTSSSCDRARSARCAAVTYMIAGGV